MYTFRFNPVFQRWVLLGEAVPHTLPLGKLQFQQPPKGAEDFSAAHFPASPFMLDAAEQPMHQRALPGETMFDEQPPVGEYELMLYHGDTAWENWKAAEWQQWMTLFIDRLHLLHLNFHVSYAGCAYYTRARQSLEGREDAMRVGDIIAASHPIVGLSTPVERDLIERLVKNEKLFVLAKEEIGFLYAPSAPTQRREVWLLPTNSEDIESMSAKNRQSFGKTMAALFRALHEEFPKGDWVVQLHLPPLGKKSDETWWVQIYEDVSAPSSPLPVAPLPERFVRLLKHILAAHSAK